MAFSKTEVCNGALALLGEATITSIDQDNKAARLLKRVYDSVRKQTLLAHRWNHATKRAELAASATDPAFGFLYQFPLPSDFNSLIGVWNDGLDNRNYTSESDPYKVEGNYLLFDSSPAYVFYTADITDEGQWTPGFVEVFQHNLAIRIFYSLTKGADRYRSLQQERAVAIRQAKFSNAIENSPEVFVASTWIDSRYENGGPLRDNNSV